MTSKRDSRFFFVADLREIRRLTYCIPVLCLRHVSNETTACTLYRSNLQRHRAVVLRQHGSLVVSAMRVLTDKRKIAVTMANLELQSRFLVIFNNKNSNKKLSYCWETVRRESMPRIAEMDVEMTT